MSVVSCTVEEEEQPPLSPPIGSIIGVWTINETVPGGIDPRCAPPAATYNLYVAQNGNTVIAQAGFAIAPLDPTLGSNGTQFKGFVSGSTLALEGANPQGIGTLTTARVAVVAPGCNALITGNRTFSYTDPNFSCNGAYPFTGTRMLGSGCAGTLTATAVPESSMPHNTAGTAQVIATRPAEVSGTIGVAEEDWYTFALSAQEVVTILLDGPAAPQNIDLFLGNDADTTTLASSISTSSREAVAATLGAGTYRIRVTSTAVTETASYKLLIQ